MAASRRRVSDQGAKLRRRTTASAIIKALPKHRLGFAAMAVPCLVVVFAATLVANLHSDVGCGTRVRCPPFEDAASHWSRVVERLQSDVPARLLLGASGKHAVFDAELAIEGVTRAEFQAEAAIVLRAVAAVPDNLSDHVLAMALEDFPFPEGIEVPDVSSNKTYTRSVVLDDARRLVHGLSAKLRGDGSTEEK